MTKESAIEMCKVIDQYLCAGNPIWSTEVIHTAMSMAIDALIRQTAIKEKCCYCPHCSNCDVNDDLSYTGFGQWIPCSERLPEPGEYYLVTRQYFGWNCTEYREIDIAKYDFDGWHKADTVLAWCEMPEPYQEEQP